MPGTDIEAPRSGRRTVVICGYGRIGGVIGRALERRGFGYIVIEDDGRITKELRDRGIAVIRGFADNAVVLEQTGLDRAAVLAVAVPDPIAARTIVDLARRSNPRLPIVARAHSGRTGRPSQAWGRRGHRWRAGTRSGDDPIHDAAAWRERDGGPGARPGLTPLTGAEVAALAPSGL